MNMNSDVHNFFTLHTLLDRRVIVFHGNIVQFSIELGIRPSSDGAHSSCH